MAARFLISAFLLILGFLSIKYTEPIVRAIGYNNWAERYLGGGGTYTMWKLIGILLILAAFFTLTGDLQFGVPQVPIDAQ